MGNPAKKIPSFDELYRQIEALPQGTTGEILEPGVLSTMSRPGFPHRLAARRVQDALRGVDRVVGGSGWWIEVEAEIQFGDVRLAVPDLAGWRLLDDQDPAFLHENPITTAPDWVCETLSPTTARDDRRVKLPLYARFGVEWIWLVDPDARMIEVFEGVQGFAVLRASAADDELAALPPFGIPIALGDLWRAEPPP